MSAIAGDAEFAGDDPAEGEPIHLGDARIRVLPDPAEVFVAEQPWLARALHPLVAIDLAALDPSLDGWAPLLSPVEPEGGQHPERQREGWSAELPAVDRFGGEPGYGNWATNPPPAALQLDEGEEYRPVLRLADGRPFRFVAATSGYPWREQGADAILLFVEPETRTLVLTLDWS